MAALLCLLRGIVWTRPLLHYRVVDIWVMTPQIRLPPWRGLAHTAELPRKSMGGREQVS
mgnify:CR=1 FL=1